MTKRADARDVAQIERFKEAARALGYDDDEAAFDEKLRTLARARPGRLSSPGTDLVQTDSGPRENQQRSPQRKRKQPT